MTRWISVLAGALALPVIALGQAAPPGGAEALRADGARLFFERGCHGCHTVGTVGTPIAADLGRIGRKYPQEVLQAWLRDPASQKPTAHMPKIQLADSEVLALAAYLASLK